MTTGHCLCGQLSFVAEGEPKVVAYCHCASCRRHSGSPVAAFVIYPAERVRFTGKRSTYASSAGVIRSHCATCGTPIAYQTDRRPGDIDLYLGAFDAPENFEPRVHVHFAEHLPWFDTRDDAPRLPGT